MVMSCRNHPEAGATTRCTGCAESFCPNCVVELAGQMYCGACKVMAIGNRTLVIEDPNRSSKDANRALTFSIIGLLLCSVFVSLWGIGLAIAALVVATKARHEIATNPQVTGSGKAVAAIIVASAGLANAVINLIFIVQTS
jgi:hypothetical protein